MPKVRFIQTNFSSGEISPQAAGRVDIARYNNGAKKIRNVISRTLGGGKKRPGLEFIRAAKTGGEALGDGPRLIPFIVSQTVAYMLEMGEGYCRFFTPDGNRVLFDDGGPGPHGPLEIDTPFTQDQLGSIDYAQSEIGMYLFHGEVYPQLLKRFDEDNWDCSDAPFSAIPFEETGDYPAAEVTLSLATVGTGRTATASAASFLVSDIGRAIIWKTGIGVITAFTSTTVVTVEIVTAFSDVSIPGGEWNLDSSPQTTLTLSAPAATPEMDPPGSPVTCTLSANGWRTTDVGKYVRLNNGLVKLTAYTSPTVMTGMIILEVSSVVGAPALAWTLNGEVWSDAFGYPRTGTIHEQRLVTAGTVRNPQTVWGSRSGEELDFTIGPNDDDAYSFTISGNDSQVNLINYLASARDLLALTYGGEYAVTGGPDKAITPTNVKIKIQTPHGSQQVRPITISRQTVFAQRAGRKLRAMAYNFEDDGYNAADLTTLAEHVTATGIKTMAFQQEPDPVLWIVLNNGKLVACTVDKDLDIIAFNPQVTDGAFDDVAVMPSGDLEQVWFLVRREIDGGVVRHVERLQPDWYPIYGTTLPDADTFPPGDEPVNWGFQLDSALSLESGTPETVWDGLDHLEGREVRVIADGAELTNKTVTGGEITLEREAQRILVGLFFKPEIELLTPEIQGANGSVQGTAMSTNEVILKVHETIGATVDGQEVLFSQSFDTNALDVAPVPFTGDESVSAIGWNKGRAEVIISQDHPFPFHILAVVRSITINEG
jgi:hypothetical protein